MRDFLYEFELVFDAKPYTYTTNKVRIIYSIHQLTNNASVVTSSKATNQQVEFMDFVLP